MSVTQRNLDDYIRMYQMAALERIREELNRPSPMWEVLTRNGGKWVEGKHIHDSIYMEWEPDVVEVAGCL